MGLTIDKHLADTTAAVALIGRLDTVTAPALEAELAALPPTVTALTFDLAKLEYISSAGLRVLLKTQKAMNQKGSLKLIHVPETVMEVFDITGFREFLTIEN